MGKMDIEYRLDFVHNFRLLGFATGSYINTCIKCSKEFTGDKRATICLECAIKKANELYKQVESYNNLKGIIPPNATNLEVFAVKESNDSPTGLQAFIGFNNEKGVYGFIQVPFIDHPLNSYNKKGRKEELEEKIVNQAENIRIMEELIRNQKKLITHIQGTLEEKNKMLDALHYVWCDGGYVGGVHRYKEMSNIPLTEETVRKAESNTYRLRMWFVNNKFRKRKITLKYYKTFKYRIREILRKLYFALV